MLLSRPWCFASLLLVFVAVVGSQGLAQPNTVPPKTPSIELSRMFQDDPLMRDQWAQQQDYQQDLFAPVSPGDDDIGVQQILQERERIRRWLVFGEAAGFYTSNVALLNDFVEDDSFLVTGFGLSYQHQVGGSLLLNATVRQQFFRYDEYDAFDFDSFTISVQATYVLHEAFDIALFSRYSYNRLTQPTLEDEFFNNQTLSFGAQKVFPMSRAHFWYIGAEAQLGWASPQEAGRNEYAFFLGYTVQLTRALNANLFYRFSYYDYDLIGRQDVNNTVTVALAYTLFEVCEVQASVSAVFNDSDVDVFDYEVVNPGGGLQVKLRF